jgi:hypothetical protein
MPHCASRWQPAPCAGGGLPGSIGVAVARNSTDNLDSHCGSCPRYLVYEDGKTLAIESVPAPVAR